jgi:hypothetical protein
MTKQWEIIKKKEEVQYDIDPNAHVFGICVDGVVQLTLVVDEVLAGLYDLGPQLVRVKPSTVPGMTVEEAKA